MEEINILLSVNKKFLEHAEDLIASILHYANKKINFYLMYIEKELSQADIENLSKFTRENGNGEIVAVKFDASSLEGAPVTDNEGSYFGLEAYSRLFSPFKLPNIDKVLYLDVDMICTGDIEELYNIDFEGKMWCGCSDDGIKEEDLDRLSLPHNSKYINSGMLLINLKALRESYKEEDIVRLILENQAILIYPDQDFINKIFHNQIKIVPEKYNLVAKDIRYKDLKEKPLIIHYAGSIKPWFDNVSRFELGYMEPYYDALRFQGEYKKAKLDELIKKHQENGYRI